MLQSALYHRCSWLQTVLVYLTSPAVSRLSSHSDSPDMLYIQFNFNLFVYVALTQTNNNNNSSNNNSKTYRAVPRLVLSMYKRRLCDLLRVYLPRHHHHRRRRRRHWVTVTNFAAAAVAKIRLCTFSLSRRREQIGSFAGAVYSRAASVSSQALKLGYLDVSSQALKLRCLLSGSQTWLPWCQKLMTFRPARPGARPPAAPMTSS